MDRPQQKDAAGNLWLKLKGQQPNQRLPGVLFKILRKCFCGWCNCENARLTDMFSKPMGILRMMSLTSEVSYTSRLYGRQRDDYNLNDGRLFLGFVVLYAFMFRMKLNRLESFKRTFSVASVLYRSSLHVTCTAMHASATPGLMLEELARLGMVGVAGCSERVKVKMW